MMTIDPGTVRLTVLVQMLAESLARRISDTVEHEVQRLLRGTDGAHAVVDTTRAGQM